MKQSKSQVDLLKLIAQNSEFTLPKRKNNKIAKELERALKAGLVKKEVRLIGRSKKEESFYVITKGGLSKLDKEE